jgi:hypothetical protein
MLPVMNGNGVAKEFWSEVFDLRSPVDDGPGGRQEIRRKKQRRVLVRRPQRTAS